MSESPLLCAIVLRGVPGAGKSTLAVGLAARSEAAGVAVRVLSRDELRKQMFAPCDWNDGETYVAFIAMLHTAAYHLAQGRSVIFDGMPFTRATEINAVRNMAQAALAQVIVVDCEIPLDVAEARVAADVLTRDPDYGREHGINTVRIAAERQEPCEIDIAVDMTRTPERIADDVFAALFPAQASGSTDG